VLAFGDNFSPISSGLLALEPQACLFIVNGGKGLKQITIALYLKLIKATYVQVCWLFGANFSPTSSFLSSPSNFRAAVLLLKTEGKGWSRSQLYFI
jgi:hypothetical protein